MMKVMMMMIAGMTLISCAILDPPVTEAFPHPFPSPDADADAEADADVGPEE